MKSSSNSRRRPSVHVTLARAARLHGMITYLAESPRNRETILTNLRIGLRTFYRELELLKRCGVKVRLKNKAYTLLTTAREAEGRLPFPDPQLSFAEMAELARGPSEAARRLAAMLASVVSQAVSDAKSARKRKAAGGRAKAKA